MAERLLGAEHSLTNGKSRAIDLTLGGQQGLKRDNTNWVSGTPYTKQKLIATLLRAPGGFRFMPDGADRVRILKALIELHSKSITGLNSSLTVDVGETQVNNNEMMQTVTKTTRERSNPVHTFTEVYGKAVTTFFKDWIVDLLQDPESGHPGIAGREEYTSAGSPPLLADMVSASVLYYEPNPERSAVQGEAYMCVNMFPLGVTDEAQRVMGEGNELQDVEISFSALTSVGKAVSLLASAQLESLNKAGVAVDALALAETEIAADVAAAEGGYVSGQEELANAIP